MSCPSPASVRPHGAADPLPKSIPHRRAADSHGRAAVDALGMIEATGLTKRLGGRVVVSDVSFRCEPGTVTGFLGPNGAGKTTTMRMVVGLSTPDAGASRSSRATTRAPQPGPKVGVLLDAAPSTRAAAAARRSPSRADDGRADTRVNELLALVGLDKSAARKRVRQYSLGMRQRLGLAHALLGDPQVLILDEPANGLDPEGIRWMRGLLRDFADRGGTVLLSSHLLLEVEAVADRLLIIGNGKIVAAGSREELLAGTGVLVRATDARALERALDGSATPHRGGLRRRRRRRARRPCGAHRRGRPDPPWPDRRRRPGGLFFELTESPA